MVMTFHTSTSMFIIVGICFLVLLIGVLRRKAEILLNIIVRMVVGLFAIYACNQFFAQMGIPVAVGMNPLSAGTVGLLGIGGFALLYGIVFYSNH